MQHILTNDVVIPLFGANIFQQFPLLRFNRLNGAEVVAGDGGCRMLIEVSLRVNGPFPVEFIKELRVTVRDNPQGIEHTVRVGAYEVDGTTLTLRTTKLYGLDPGTVFSAGSTLTIAPDSGGFTTWSMVQLITNGVS